MAQNSAFRHNRLDWLANIGLLLDHRSPLWKLERITVQIRSIQSSARLTLRDLQSLVGRLLWLTSAWRHLRPLLIPLYKALHRIPITMVYGSCDLSNSDGTVG